MLLTLLIGFMPLPVDPDLWFHLADGERILATGQVPRSDPFSFTREGTAWVPHSWLFDVATALSWHHLGPRTTEAIMGLVFMLAAVLSFSLLCGRGVAPLTAAMVCAGLAIAAGNTRGIRPQVFSLLLCNVLIWLCVRHRYQPRRVLLLAMPAVFLLWAQLHAGCVMGLLAATAWFGGRCFEVLLEAFRHRHAMPTHGHTAEGDDCASSKPHDWRKELSVLAVSLCLSIGAVLLTPHAMTHFEYVRLTMGLSELGRTEEWQAPRALLLRIPDLYLYVLVTVIVTLLARRRRQIGWAELSLCLSLMVLAFTGVRHIPLLCIGSVPLLADMLTSHSRRQAGADGRERPTRTSAAKQRGGFGLVRIAWSPRFLVTTACLAGVVLLCFWRYPSDIESRYRQAEPVNGARALAAMDRPLRVFTTYNTGSSVLHASHGRLKVFVDSRADVYGDEILHQAREAAAGRGWQSLFDRWRIDAAVVERTSALAAILRRQVEWTLVAEDPRSLTFARAVTKPHALGQMPKTAR